MLAGVSPVIDDDGTRRRHTQALHVARLLSLARESEPNPNPEAKPEPKRTK
jgi:hypothetical protein